MKKPILNYSWIIPIIFMTLQACTIGTPSREEVKADEELVQIGDDIAIADTQYGKVQGFILRGIYQFRGIPYGADTGGKNRFMPPQPPEPWDDIYPAVWWGNSAPQIMDNRYANPWYSFRDHWNYDDVSEDCLKLNVWTPALADGRKRPVLVWFHGGGFTNGNAIEQEGYKGENLSRKGDIVFVSINHRLGPIGFSDLSGVGGPAYAHSGNAGALDMVAALEWVQNNIENFGGDPGNVTIMGQSGGGAKVCTLLAMPATRGMIHKAVPLSGNITGAIDQHYSQLVGVYILREAGLKPSGIGKLQEMPWKEYIELANRAARKCAEEQGGSGRMRGSFGPVADGVDIPTGTFYSDPAGPGAHVPMLISSTFNEWSGAWVNPELASITREKAIDMLAGGEGLRVQLGEAAEKVYQAYADAFPEASPYEVVTLISSNRKAVIRTANAKSVQPAPVYVAWFGWDPPLFGGRMGAFHCLDICFWFDNTDEMWSHTGGGAKPRNLAEKMSGTLLQFMKTGDPNDGGLPHWPVYTPEKGETMVLNDVSEVRNDPDRAARALIPD